MPDRATKKLVSWKQAVNASQAAEKAINKLQPADRRLVRGVINACIKLGMADKNVLEASYRAERLKRQLAERLLAQDKKPKQ